MNRFLMLLWAVFVISLTACGDSGAASKAQIFETLLTAQRSGGVTLAGGKAYFYVPGTTNYKTIYADRNKVTPAANPYTLSSDGTAMVYGDGLYDVKITNSAGVQKFLWEDVQLRDALSTYVEVSTYAELLASVTSSDAEGATVRVTAPIVVTSAITWPTDRELSFAPGAYVTFTGSGSLTGLKESRPEWFGADNTGTTDCTTAMHAARNASPNIKLGRGTYKGNFTFYTFSRITGEGIGLTKLIPNDNTAAIVSVSQSSTAYSYIKGFGFSISDLIIDGGYDHTAADPANTTSLDNQNHGIYLNAGTATVEPNSSIGNIEISRVIITACGGNGIWMDGRGNGTDGSIYSQVAWVKINNVVVTWNMGVGVLVEGVAHQTHITGASLIEKNSRGCPKATTGNNINFRAQVLYKNYGSTVGFPAKHTIDGSTTIQTGDDTFTVLAASNAVGVSIHGAQSVSIRDCWLESSDSAIWVSSTVSRSISIKDNYITGFATNGIILHAGDGIVIDGNEFYQNASAGTGTHANPSNFAGLANVAWINNTYVNIATRRNVSNSALSAGFKYMDQGEIAEAAKSHATSGATLTVDLSIARVHFILLSHNITINLTNPKAGETYTFIIHQTTLANTVAWDGALFIKWSGGAAPVITTTNNRGDVIQLFHRTNGSYYELNRLTNVPS